MSKQPNIYILPLYDTFANEPWPRLRSQFTRLYPVSPTLQRDLHIASILHSPWLTVRAAQDEMLREYKIDAAKYLGRVNAHIEEQEKCS